MENTVVVFCSPKKAGIWLLALWLSVLLCNITGADTVPQSNAHKMVRAWLAANAKPMGSRLGSQVDSIETFNDAKGQPAYHVVYLRPNGFVIVPADDEVEPIICFASAGSYDPSDRNPLGAMVSRDLPGRVNAARAIQKKTSQSRTAGSLTSQETAVRKAGRKALGKWKKLLGEADTPSVPLKSIGSVSDVRVAPLLQTRWGQDIICGNACFNYYTPPYGSGNTDNYYCGCVATAMAQYMRFWQYPTTGVGTGCFTINVDGSPETACLRGGNGSGGAYNWSQMTLVPNCSTTLTQRQAIGALTYDAGVAVEMNYGDDGSYAYLDDAAAALVDTFDYSNAILGFNNGNNISTGLNGMVNTNLDYGNPVILGITSPDDGHAVVTDGYGYESSTLYHHLNMGWDGIDDVWYNLPDIDATLPFNTVYNIIYNIYTSGTGEIISGRVTADSCTPVANATVTAQRTGGGTYLDTTNANGIYAIANVPSNSTYTVSVDKNGYSFTSQITSTGQSQDDEAISGNCWAIDFNGTVLGPVPIASDSDATADSGLPETITLQATDDGQPDPPGALTYIITSLPSHGTLTDPCDGSINTVPYSLKDYGKDVIYTSTSNYTGTDSFQFKVNDGGSSPDGGDSDVAIVSVTVQLPSTPRVVYETSFDAGLPDGWTIIDGGSSSDTWQSYNPGKRASTNWTGLFMVVDSRYAGAVNMDEQLITQDIDCTNLNNIKLRFKHTFYRWSNEIGDVDIRVSGGKWQNMARYNKVSNYGGLVELNLSNFGADGEPEVQIRWHYYKAKNDTYWGIDDVQIIASRTAPTVTVNKCNVSAGKKNNSDKISASGTMNAGTGHFSGAANIRVTVDSDDLVAPYSTNFPINTSTFKKGKYKYSKTVGGVKKSFTYNVKTRKFTLSISKVDLSGLGCPLTVQIEIGDFDATDEIGEAIVNGKRPIPIQLMTGVMNVLRVDRCKVKQGKKPNTDKLLVGGAFAVENPNVSMAGRINTGLVITLDTQTFTIPAGRLKAGKGKFSCTKAAVTEDGSIAAATFNFNTCSFTLTIKNTNIPTGLGNVDFGASFTGFDEVDDVTLP